MCCSQSRRVPTHLYHRRVSVLLHIPYDFDGAVATRFPVPAFQYSSKCSLSKGSENFICEVRTAVMSVKGEGHSSLIHAAIAQCIVRKGNKGCATEREGVERAESRIKKQRR